MAEAPTRVAFLCTSVGITHRGIESFFREAYDALHHISGIEVMLVKGGGGSSKGEKRVWCLPKTSPSARLLGSLTGRSAYAVEQWTAFLPTLQLLRSFAPDVIFSSDANTFFLLRRFRRFFSKPFSLLYSNGGPCRPPFPRYDMVHQVAPMYLDQALAAGEPAEKHFLVPYGITVPDGPPVADEAEKQALRKRLGLPLDRKIILSVGWIAAKHKRMDYVVREMARTYGILKSGNAEKRKSEGSGRAGSQPSSLDPQPFLVLLGQMDEQSPPILTLAREKLGEGNFLARSVPYEQVADYYRAADCFVLASLQEGFGRVYLEALIHGLPVIAHEHPVMRYVLGDEGTLVDLSQPGTLAQTLARELEKPSSPELVARRRESVRTRFSWPVLAPRYREMFQTCRSLPLSANPSAKA